MPKTEESDAAVNARLYRKLKEAQAEDGEKRS